MNLLRMIVIAMTLGAIGVSEAQNINCLTTQANCAGKARFIAGNEAEACVIWKDDGKRGFTNFTLQPHQVVWYTVGYNDRFACGPIQNGTPKYQSGLSGIQVLSH